MTQFIFKLKIKKYTFFLRREVKHALAQVGPDALCDIRMVDPCVSRVYRESEMAEENCKVIHVDFDKQLVLVDFVLIQ